MSKKHDPIDYAVYFGSGCRDCADANGVCPSAGTPCNTTTFRAVVEHTLTAWRYGIEHGFMENPFSALLALAGGGLELPYKNWRGEIAVRKLQPLRLEYGSTDWHPEPQWLLIAIDIEKNAERSFALKDFNPPAPAEATLGASTVSPEEIEAALTAYCGTNGVLNREAYREEIVKMLEVAAAVRAKQEPVRYQRLSQDDGVWREVKKEDIPHYQRYGQRIRGLYAGPPIDNPVK